MFEAISIKSEAACLNCEIWFKPRLGVKNPWLLFNFRSNVKVKPWEVSLGSFNRFGSCHNCGKVPKKFLVYGTGWKNGIQRQILAFLFTYVCVYILYIIYVGSLTLPIETFLFFSVSFSCEVLLEAHLEIS